MTDPRRLASEAQAFATDKGKLAGLGTAPGAEQADLDAAAQAYLARNPRPLSQAETIAQKRAYQARGSYSPRVNAPPVTNEQTNFDTGIANAARRSAIARQPELEGALSKEQDLLGALIAEQNTEARGTPSTVAGLLRHVAMGPRVMGASAIGLDRLGNIDMAQLARLALLAGLKDEEPPMAASH
jgi:hypothetical protein